MFFSTPAIDLQLFLLINQQWQSALFDTIMPLISAMSILMIILAAALALAIRKGGKRQLIYFLILFIGMGLSDFSTKLVKAQVYRVRPLNAIAGTRYVEDGQWRSRPPNYIRTKERGSSYPSAHCANTMSLAILAMLLWPRLKKWPLLVPLAVGYSRVYLGKHYPTDVLAGWLWGVVIAGAVWLIWKEIERHSPALRADQSSGSIRLPACPRYRRYTRNPSQPDTIKSKTLIPTERTTPNVDSRFMPAPNRAKMKFCGTYPRVEPRTKGISGMELTPAARLVIKLLPSGNSLMAKDVLNGSCWRNRFTLPT